MTDYVNESMPGRFPAVAALVLAYVAPSFADVRFERLGVEQGLPGSYVIDIAQDANGFLWLADNNDGLIRFDGYEFRAYRHDPADSQSISSNDVTEVYVDGSGTLWVSTGAGLDRYDARTDRFSRINTESREPAGLSNNYVGFALVDSAGRLWVGTTSGLNRLDPGSKRFKQYHVEHEFVGGAMAPDYFWTGFEDSEHRLWFGTLGGGLLRYDAESDSLEQFLYDRTLASPPVINVRSIAQDGSGLLWLASENGVSTLDPETRQFRRIHWRNSREDINVLDLPDMLLPFWSVESDSSGNLWLATYGAGLFRIAPDRKSWVQLRRDMRDPTSISGNDVWEIFIDRSGQIWFANAQDGLNHFNPLTEAVDYVAFRGPNEQATINRLAALPDGRLIAGTSNDGVWMLDPHDSQWTQLPWPDTASNPVGRGSWATTHKTVEDLWVTSDATIWVASNPSPKLFRIDVKERTAKTLPQPNRPSRVYLDRQGALWIAAPFHHLARVDLETGARVEWHADRDDPASLGSDSIWEVFEDQAGRMWFGTYDGLEQWDPKSARFRRYDANPSRRGALPAGDVRRVVEDEQGDLWISSDAGITRFDHRRDAFEHFPLHEFPVDAKSVGGITDVVGSRLWWTSTTGLTSFDLRSRQYRRYSHGEGIAAAPKGVAALPDGRIALAYPDRIGLFSPERLVADPNAPLLSLTAIRLGNRPLETGRTDNGVVMESSAWTANRISLPHDHEPLTFEFAALHFASSARNRYAYRMEGLDQEWLETDARNRRATYTTLPPGNYMFRAKAANPDGLWNDIGVEIDVTVMPPWWMTWWAYVLYGLVVLLLMLGTSWYRTRSLRSRAALLEAEVATRTEELVEQKRIVEQQALHVAELAGNKDRLMTRVSHEFRTPLTVILGPIDRLQAAATTEPLQTYLATAKRNASRLMRLVDQMLSLARLKSGHAEPPRPVLAAPVVKQAIASFESLALDRDLDFAPEVIEDLTLQTTVDGLEKIVVNLISNAIKFSRRGGRIRVSLTQGPGVGTLVVSDTGRGIAAGDLPHIFEPFKRGNDDAEHIPGSGLGLALVHELVTAHGGQVKVESTPDLGSTFRVLLPLATEPAIQAAVGSVNSEDARLAVAAMTSGDPVATHQGPESIKDAAVLVIEDNPDMRAYLAQVLGQVYQLAFANDGDAGLEAAFRDVPDLVLSDIMLPGKDGYEVCHALKTDDRTSHIPVILLTALESREDRLKGLAERADDYLIKPFDEAELLQRIANLLALRALLQRRFARDLRFESPLADLSKRDQAFLQKLARITGEHHADAEFDVSRLASTMAAGERNLQRKLKALLGMTPAEYLREYRLQQAMERLRAGERPGEVAFATGFVSQAHFSKCFRAQFGLSPSEVRSPPRQG